MNEFNDTRIAIDDEFDPGASAFGRSEHDFRRKTTKETPAKGPWNKQMLELSKYDWYQALGLSQFHKNRPLDLRVAYALMQFADAGSKLAWPSQKTLALYAGVANDRQVRTALKSLRASGALATVSLCKLKQSERDRIKRHGRGIAYRLNMFWASEIFEGDPKIIRIEPPSLRAHAGARKRTDSNRSSRTGVGLPRPDDIRPANTEEKLDHTEKRKEMKDKASPSKSNAYAQAKCRTD